MTKRKAIASLSRNFVIPAGTQVVLQVSKNVELAPDDGDEIEKPVKKPGSVGVVIKCPAHNDLPYTLQFSDGSQTAATFDELVLRRQEIDNLLVADEKQFREFVIYRCQVGSKAFGLSNDESDDDYRGIFLPPAEAHWSMYKIPEQIESNDGVDDEVYWEMEKFLSLAIKANPNILETLWTPIVLEANPIALKLREIRNAFLSKHIYKTYSGYVLSQFRRMKNSFEKTGKYKPKHAMHLIRLLHSGIGCLQTGEIMIDVSQHRDSLMRVRNKQFTFEEVRQKALELDRDFQSAFESTTLPEQPDFDVVNEFLVEARRSMVR
ncbi:MAG: nucleotidyltransferase domain-containing protein [Mariniblastus sp.]